ncbi:hypothetical protein ACH82I_12375 [Brevibacterium sp. GP-SGM9]|uniref:hypothetical protein n=1 Tax=Brevibacterium sp. GP-SGM9 TaxID=3376990 RepID=UPI0039A45930
MTRQPSENWIVVDVGRVMRLPERLRCLWPPEFLPDSVPEPAGRSVPGGTEPVGRSAPGGTETVVLDLPPEQSARGLDVLSAWLAGFAADLNLTHSRITIVVTSGTETVQLALCLGADSCRAVLTLGGDGLVEFAGYQLLRRIGPAEITQVVDDLTDLVDADCVLTLSYIGHSREAGMEFLHRVDGSWRRPVLERSGETITVGAEADAGEAAVRTLLTATLARLWTSSLGGPG